MHKRAANLYFNSVATKILLMLCVEYLFRRHYLQNVLQIIVQFPWTVFLNQTVDFGLLYLFEYYKSLLRISLSLPINNEVI